MRSRIHEVHSFRSSAKGMRPASSSVPQRSGRERQRETERDRERQRETERDRERYIAYIIHILTF